MKYIIILFLITGFNLNAQKYLTKTGHITFEASVPSFEEVKAENESVTAIINTETGDIAALALVKGFRFKNALMEEHFNENYAESDTYPKATFKGKIVNLDLENIENSNVITGSLSFHGKSKDISISDVKIRQSGNKITVNGSFKTIAADFDIEIPKIVSNKISEDIEVTISFELLKK